MRLAVICYDLSSKAPSIRARSVIESIAKNTTIDKIDVITSFSEGTNLDFSDLKTNIEVHYIMSYINPLSFIQMLAKMRVILKTADLVHVPINFIQALTVRLVYDGPISLGVGIQQSYFWRCLTKLLIKPAFVFKPNPLSARAWKNLGIKSNYVLPPRDWNVFKHYSKEKINEIKKKEHIPKDKSIILYVGKLTEFKGAHIFHKIAKMLKKDRNDVCFVVIGDGPLRTLFLDDEFMYKGFLPNNELPKYYNIADITVVPNERAATFGGLIAAESAACGTPVINTTESIFKIHELEKAYFWCKREPSSIMNYLHYLLNNKKTQRKKSIMGKKIVKEVFPSYEELAKLYMDTFQEVLDNRERRREN